MLYLSLSIFYVYSNFEKYRSNDIVITENDTFINYESSFDFVLNLCGMHFKKHCPNL